MSYGFHIRITKALHVHPEAMVQAVRMLMGEAGQIIEQRVSTDEDPMTISTLVTNMTAAAHTIDLDGSVSATTSTPDAETATLFAFTMELPAASSGCRMMLCGVGR